MARLIKVSRPVTLYDMRLDERELRYLLALAEEAWYVPPDSARGLLYAEEGRELIGEFRRTLMDNARTKKDPP